MTAQALVKLIIRVDGVPELQRTAEGMRRATQAIKETEGAFGNLDRQFRRGVHAPTFAPGWQQAGSRGIGGTIGAGVGVAGGALLGAIRAHPLLTIAGGLFAAHQAIRSFGEEELILARTEALLRTQGIGDMREATRVATEMSNKTLPSYHQQIEAIGSLLLITNDYKRSLGDLSVVNDIASVTGWDLNTASLAYGRALEGDMLLLGKYVHKLKELTEEQKKNQGLVRATIAEAVRGQAEAQAQTPTGQLIQAKKQINEAMRVVGGVLTTSLAVPARGLLAFMKSPEFFHDLEGLQESARVASEAVRIKFSPKQRIAEQAFARTRESIASTDRDIRSLELVKRARNEMEAQATILGRIRELKGAIAKESFSETANLDLIKKALGEIRDLEEKRKKLQEEIAGIQAGPALGRIGKVGALTGAVAGLGGEPGTWEQGWPSGRWQRTGGTGKFALMERFGGRQLAPGLTLGGALSENQGITGFDWWRQSQLLDILQKKDVPTAFRSQIAEQLFQAKLDMLGRATTPGMQAQMFGGAVSLMGLSQRIDEQKAGEDIEARKEMIGVLRDGNLKLDKIAEILEKKTSVPDEVNFHEGRG